MLYTTEAEYVVAIAETQLALSRGTNIGHTHLNRSGGSERSTTETSSKDLRVTLATLQKEYADLVAKNAGANRSTRFGAGW